MVGELHSRESGNLFARLVAMFRQQLSALGSDMYMVPAQSPRFVIFFASFERSFDQIEFCIFHHTFTGFVGNGIGFAEREYLVWYILFTLFVPYAMLPLPLKWCMIGGTITAFTHIIMTTVKQFQKTKEGVDPMCVVKQMVANTLLYVAINFAGMYTKYLTDRGQRLAFIETHKAMEHKKESEKEYQKTQRLLDSSELTFDVIKF